MGIEQTLAPPVTSFAARKPVGSEFKNEYRRLTQDPFCTIPLDKSGQSAIGPVPDDHFSESDNPLAIQKPGTSEA